MAERLAETGLTRYISEDPDYPGPADARLQDAWIHVWALIGALQGNGWDLDDVANAYGISREAVEVAVAYYHRHRAAIDARLEANRVPSKAGSAPPEA